MQKWSQKSIQTFDDHVKNSSIVYFEATHINNECYQGKLTFENDLLQLLVNLGQAISKFVYQIFLNVFVEMSKILITGDSDAVCNEMNGFERNCLLGEGEYFVQ